VSQAKKDWQSQLGTDLIPFSSHLLISNSSLKRLTNFTTQISLIYFPIQMRSSIGDWRTRHVSKLTNSLRRQLQWTLDLQVIRSCIETTACVKQTFFRFFCRLSLSIMKKHLRLAPHETVDFVFPRAWMLRVLGNNLLFPAGPVIECLFTSTDLTNVTVTTRFSGQAGATMTIYCKAIGPNTSSFTWVKDHLALQPSYWVKYDMNSTVSVLTIRMTKKADSGNYTCNVRCK